MRTEDYKTPQMRALHALCRYETHGGYTWAAVMTDGELMCCKCVRENYRQIFRATRDNARDDWGIHAIDYDGANEPGIEHCCNCHAVIWDTREKVWFSTSSGRIEFKLLLEDAHNGSHQGRCDDDIAALLRVPYIAEQLAKIDEKLLRDELREYGAWDTAELADHDANLSRILWLACGDIVENAAQG